METVYQYVTACKSDIRIPVRAFHRQYSSYMAISSTTNALKEARAKLILIGPYTYVNTGTDVELIETADEDLDMFNKWKECTSDPNVTYTILLKGKYSMLIFKRGANVLSYAESIIPKFNSKKKVEDIWPKEKGKIEPDLYPHGWDSLDWKVFHEMRNPYVLYPHIAEKLGVSWRTVSNHFKRIMKNCKPWISFFPKGLMNYFHLFLFFRTEYEIGILNELKNLDRTSYVYKFGDTIIVYLCVNRSEDHSIFMKMENEGIIRDLSISVPSQWEKPWFKF
jgi:hypothetical protein